MKVQQRHWTTPQGWSGPPPEWAETADLVLLFASREALAQESLFEEIRRRHPRARLLGCSTAGEISGTRVYDNSLVATAVQFEDTRIQGAEVHIRDRADSFAAGRALAGDLPREGLVHVFVLSDGTSVNGSDLARGMIAALPSGVTVTGGLSGDGDRFERTLVFAHGKPTQGAIAALGFYGARLKVGFGSQGGWDPFGPTRVITRSEGNILYELDGQPALALYKRYLGDHAQGLPAAALLFPLHVTGDGGEHSFVRTIIGVDEARQTMTFAGDMPEGAKAQLMKANFDRLVDGAHGAASTSYQALGSSAPDLAILISCVGRKLLLRQRTEEEVESVSEVFGPGTVLTGFYSYGEIGPASPQARCELHNQTMTITTLLER
jgi:hypothetical protein